MDNLIYIERLKTWQEGSLNLVFHSGGILQVEDPISQKILGVLEPLSGTCLSEKDLIRRLPESAPENTLEDLATMGLVRQLHSVFKNWYAIDVITDRPNLLKPLVEEISSGWKRDVKVLDKDSHGSGDVALVFLQDYDGPFMQTWWDSAKLHYKLIQTSYLMDRFLYLDNPYIHELSTPDHRSNINNMRLKLKGENEEADNYFSFFLQSSTPTSLPLNSFEEGFILFQLFKRIEKIFGLTIHNFAVDELNLAESWDLTTGKRYQAVISKYEHPFTSNITDA